jgi:dihydrofolate reductase
MIKSMILAMTQNGVMGHKNKIPWHLPEDLRRFKKITIGHPIIMGRKTFESIGKPLPGRHNIVLSRNPDYDADGIDVVRNMLEGFVIAESIGAKETFVIGGAEIYKQAATTCDRIYLTLLEKEFKGDTVFKLSLEGWHITNREYIDGKIPHQFLIMDRSKHEMTQWLTLERLENNDLPQPRYATPMSAGIDFAACLTRPCKKLENIRTSKFQEFLVIENERLSITPNPPNPKTRTLLIEPGEVIMVPLGFKTSFGPTCCMKLYVRSSAGIRGLVLANGTGIIDPDYRGELFAAVRNQSNYTIEIKHGERIVQGILTPFCQAIVKEGTVDNTTRGNGGFGSTGTMVEINSAEPEGGPPHAEETEPTENASQTTPKAETQPN